MTELLNPESSSLRESGELGQRREAADEVLLEALAAGSSYDVAGGLANVSARTVRRRMSDPVFAGQVAHRRAARVAAVTGRLTGMCEQALGVLEQCLGSERPGDQLRAAQLVLTMTRAFHSDLAVDARLDALEAAIKPADAP